VTSGPENRTTPNTARIFHRSIETRLESSLSPWGRSVIGSDKILSLERMASASVIRLSVEGVQACNQDHGLHAVYRVHPALRVVRSKKSNFIGIKKPHRETANGLHARVAQESGEVSEQGRLA
jgi:hypothetical protein